MPPDGPWFPGCIQEWVGNSTLFPSGKGAAPLWGGGGRGGLPLHLYHSYFCPSPDNNYPTYDWVRSDPAPKNHSFAHVDSSEALRWYSLASEAGLAKAQNAQGELLDRDEDTSGESARSVELYRLPSMSRVLLSSDLRLLVLVNLQTLV